MAYFCVFDNKKMEINIHFLCFELLWSPENFRRHSNYSRNCNFELFFVIWQIFVADGWEITYLFWMSTTFSCLKIGTFWDIILEPGTSKNQVQVKYWPSSLLKVRICGFTWGQNRYQRDKREQNTGTCLQSCKNTTKMSW